MRSGATGMNDACCSCAAAERGASNRTPGSAAPTTITAANVTTDARRNETDHTPTPPRVPPPYPGDPLRHLLVAVRVTLVASPLRRGP